VGVRGCVDYDCAPNLCQEKDGFFVAAAGSLLAHVSGPAYARCLLLQRYALPRDRWNDAFGVQELRGTNLRTMYDNYPRALANLAFALDSSSNPLVVAVDRSVLDRRLDTPARRQILLANATSQPQATRASLNWLRPGTWRLARDGKPLGDFSAEALERGIPLRQDGDSSTVIEARLISAAPVPSLSSAPSASLSDLNPSGAQRGVGLPQPVCQRDRSFGGKPLSIGGKSFAKGLGCAHNTALVYDLGGRYGAFDSTVGVDDGAGPSASVAFTVFVDGVCRFDSGVMTHASRSKAVHVDVRGAKTLMLRLSSAWDNNGRSDDDLGDWVDAKLTGDTMSRSHIAPK
jgi:hypothetical protein